MMIKKEAIKAVKEVTGMSLDWDDRHYEALQLAIEALSTNTLTETISRQAAIDICRAPHMRNADCSDFEMAIMMLPPADAVQVVRCKDCKRRETDGCMMRFEEWVTIDDGDGYKDDDYIVHDYTVDDGYCSLGERKGGEDE